MLERMKAVRTITTQHILGQQGPRMCWVVTFNSAISAIQFKES